jgi:hypothetical protein
MAEFARSTGHELVLIDPSDWRTVIEHGHKLVTRDMFARKLIPELPEFARRPHTEQTAVLSGR